MFTDPDRDGITAFYNTGGEAYRLQRGIGLLESARTRELLERFLPPPPAVVYDIGGGTGVYALWLSRAGFSVHLFDLSPGNIHLAQEEAENQPDTKLAAIEVGDARGIDRKDGSAGAVLLLGPLYHLPDRVDRPKALQEARRLLKPGGILAAAVISRYATAFIGLAGYGKGTDFLNDGEPNQMVMRELEDGQHFPPPSYPNFLARAFYHLPEEIVGEVVEAGFPDANLFAVEGPGWIVPDFESVWAAETMREPILRLVRKVEQDPVIMGMSLHMLAMARKL